MRRTEALEMMLKGVIVRAVDPMYKTKQKHGGVHYFRYNRVIFHNLSPFKTINYLS